jgi:hypothetical protein
MVKRAGKKAGLPLQAHAHMLRLRGGIGVILRPVGKADLQNRRRDERRAKLEMEH